MKLLRAIRLVVGLSLAVVVPRIASAQYWMRASVDLATTHGANGIQSTNGHIEALSSGTASAEIFGPVPYVSLLLGGSFERYTEQDPLQIACVNGANCDVRFPNFNGFMGIAGLHIEPTPGLALVGQAGIGGCSVSGCSSLRTLRGDITIQPLEHLDLGIRWERLDDDNIAGNAFHVNTRMLLLRVH